MARTAKTTTNSKEEIKMAKYIVEVPEPKKGQKVSSGGIRENGRLATQFKNPIPYIEPTMPPAIITQKSNNEFIRRGQTRARRNVAGMYLLSLAWQELGEPLLRSALSRLETTIVNKLESSFNQSSLSNCTSAPSIVDVEVDEIEINNDDNNVIRFPNKTA